MEDYWEDDSAGAPVSRQANPPKSAGKIFIIHGRDDATKETVKGFIEKLELEPVILHEQVNEGRTVIEKFEEHAKEVGFAIALLTPDDVGGLNEEKQDFQPRTRQNVIFEFGYLMGRLERNRVCALRKENVEIPSDYSGVVYIPIDGSEAWKINLVRELKTAGFSVDANLAL